MINYEKDSSEAARRLDMIVRAREGMPEDDFADMFCMNRASARLFIYKVKQGIIREKAGGPRKPRQGRRGKAIELFAQGKSLEEVIKATGLKRATAMAYRWEQGRMAQHQLQLFNSQDPLLD